MQRGSRTPRNPRVSNARGKQRKRHFGSEGGMRLKKMASPLSRDLRKQHGLRRTILSKDDTVEVVVGKFKGQSGKVVELNLEKMKACVEDCTVNRSTGGTALVPIDPSNLRITELKMSEERQAFLGEILRRKNEVKRRFGLVETKE